MERPPQQQHKTKRYPRVFLGIDALIPFLYFFLLIGYTANRIGGVRFFSDAAANHKSPPSMKKEGDEPSIPLPHKNHRHHLCRHHHHHHVKQQMQ
jgi:ABC-type nickel/cobalt efflux system permease component RcnA